MKRILFKDLNQMKLYTFRRNLREWEKIRSKRIFQDLRKLKSMNIFLILQMRFLAHWILAIAFLLRWEIKFWTPNMTCIISFLLNTKKVLDDKREISTKCGDFFVIKRQKIWWEITVSIWVIPCFLTKQSLLRPSLQAHKKGENRVWKLKLILLLLERIFEVKRRGKIRIFKRELRWFLVSSLIPEDLSKESWCGSWGTRSSG